MLSHTYVDQPRKKSYCFSILILLTSSGNMKYTFLGMGEDKEKLKHEKLKYLYKTFMTHLHRSQIPSPYSNWSPVNVKIDTKSVVNFFKTFSFSLQIFELKKCIYFGDIFLGLNLTMQKQRGLKQLAL